MTTAVRTLPQWLDYAERQHAVGIDLGLDRVGRVAGRLGLAGAGARWRARKVIVAGTNGKGSTCMALEALLRGAGLRVGTTLSPHLHHFNERVRVDGEPLADALIGEGFARVEAARGGDSLTYFEYGALVAMSCFAEAGVDVAILEVGLGGRLDAMNVVDADLAVVTSIGLDHQAYLGDDLEGIGREKAGVMRPGQRVVLGRVVTDSVVAAAAALRCSTTRVGRQIMVTERARDWDFSGSTLTIDGLPQGALAADNCALALEAAGHLACLDAAVARRALAAVVLPGRFEGWHLAGGVPVILDVAHNPAGAAFLAERLARHQSGRRYLAVLGTLADKDPAGIAAALAGLVRQWVCVPSSGSRGQSAAATAGALAAYSTASAGSVRAGLEQARSLCSGDDGIVVLGSFGTVEQARDALLNGFAGAVAASPVPLAPMEVDR